MSIQRYQEYKKSGVEWLGDTPSTWTIKRLGYFFNERREKVSDKDFQPLSVTKNGIVPQLETAAKSDDGDNRKKVCSGDFVINSRSDRKGSSGASPLNGSVSLINTVIVPKENIEIKYAHYLFRSTSFQEEYYRYGKGIVADLWSTNYSEMKNISIPVPSLIEQNKIAVFLNEETDKIDRLLAEQEKLIDLLKEKRQAVISHVVTKGLNPNVKMKDSGVVWLGEVPHHWEVMTLRRCSLNVQTGGTPSLDLINQDSNDGMDWYTPGDFTDTLKLKSSTKKILANLVESSGIRIFPPHSVLIISIGGTLGKVGYLTHSASSNQQINAVIPNQKINGYFLAYSLSVKIEIMKYLSNSSTIGIMNQEKTKEIWISVPPIREQLSIANYLDEITKKLDSMISTCSSTITLLYERRSALISAAVTGQIDVSNYQPKEAT